MKNRLKVLAISIWKIIPLPTFMKSFIIRCTNSCFLVAVLGIILNDKNEVLLLRHTYRKEPWGIPGGWMNNEQPFDGLVREIFEETGLNISVDSIIKVDYFKKPNRIDILMRGKYVDGNFRHSPEVSECAFFKIGQWPDGLPDIQKKMIEQHLDDMGQSLLEGKSQ
jgi:ADP-ribose pyrophosphatase YjhB (NUDIX family)